MLTEQQTVQKATQSVLRAESCSHTPVMSSNVTVSLKESDIKCTSVNRLYVYIYTGTLYIAWRNDSIS